MTNSSQQHISVVVQHVSNRTEAHVYAQSTAHKAKNCNIPRCYAVAKSHSYRNIISMKS